MPVETNKMMGEKGKKTKRMIPVIRKPIARRWEKKTNFVSCLLKRKTRNSRRDGNDDGRFSTFIADDRP